jgi:hypothetical protein
VFGRVRNEMATGDLGIGDYITAALLEIAGNL